LLPSSHHPIIAAPNPNFLATIRHSKFPVKHPLLLSLLIYFPVMAGLAALNPRLLVLAVPVLLYVAVGYWDKAPTVQLRLQRTIQPSRLF